MARKVKLNDRWPRIGPSGAVHVFTALAVTSWRDGDGDSSVLRILSPTRLDGPCRRGAHTTAAAESQESVLVRPVVGSRDGLAGCGEMMVTTVSWPVGRTRRRWWSGVTCVNATPHTHTHAPGHAHKRIRIRAHACTHTHTDSLALIFVPASATASTTHYTKNLQRCC